MEIDDYKIFKKIVKRLVQTSNLIDNNYNKKYT